MSHTAHALTHARNFPRCELPALLVAAPGHHNAAAIVGLHQRRVNFHGLPSFMGSLAQIISSYDSCVLCVVASRLCMIFVAQLLDVKL